MKKLIIESIEQNSIFEEMGITAGDAILTINGTPVEDIMDYRYLIADEQLLVEIEKQNGEIWELDIEKDFSEDLGLAFQSSMIKTRTCKNNCIFCFIDQMPEGMRKTLYVKDDDERLSFLLGNYITLTNLTDAEIERIIRYKIMPINISVHTTNDNLRCQMLNNRFAGGIMKALRHFADNGITMNGQIVLCPGYNDENELRKTLEDLMTLYPYMQSVSVVPVGLTQYREGLTALRLFNKSGAETTLDIIKAAQDVMQTKHGVNFVYPSDEFFLLAERDIPCSAYYDGFPQIENGVGMLRDFEDSLKKVLKTAENPCNAKKKKIGLITGKLAAPFIRRCAEWIENVSEQISITVYPIRNTFFGEKITVAGLVTAEDILKQTEPEREDLYLIPDCMLTEDNSMFLDDKTPADIEKGLNRPVIIIKTEGSALANACFEIIKEK